VRIFLKLFSLYFRRLSPTTSSTGREKAKVWRNLVGGREFSPTNLKFNAVNIFGHFLGFWSVVVGDKCIFIR